MRRAVHATRELEVLGSQFGLLDPAQQMLASWLIADIDAWPLGVRNRCKGVTHTFCSTPLQIIARA